MQGRGHGQDCGGRLQLGEGIAGVTMGDESFIESPFFLVHPRGNLFNLLFSAFSDLSGRAGDEATLCGDWRTSAHAQHVREAAGPAQGCLRAHDQVH
jgi:hypothetical protein